MSIAPVLSIIAWTPLAAALLIAVLGRQQQIARAIALIAATVCLGCSAHVYATYDRTAGGLQFLETHTWIPSLGITYTVGVDGISVPMLMLMGLVMFTGVLVSWNLTHRTREFFVLLLMLVTGVFGVFISVDAFLLFFFYEMAVLPMYLLIAIWGSTRKDYSAMKLTLFLFAGSALVLLALALIYLQVGTNTFDIREWAAYSFPPVFQRWVFLLTFVGFGTLIPIWPLHTWSPDGHVAAPTAVSMMHAGVLLKIGAYGVIRIGMSVLPQGLRDWAILIAIIGAINVVYGAFCAMNQKDLKYMLGYSSISHMGYVLLGFAMIDKFALQGAVFQMFAHGIMTALFFSLIGYVYEHAHTRQIEDISGLMTRAPLVAAAFVVASAASMGLPSTSGFVAELLVYVGIIMRSPALAVVVFSGVVVTAAYLVRMLGKTLLGEPSDAVATLNDPSPTRFAPMAILSVTIMVVGLFPASMYETISVGVAPLLAKLTGGG